MEKIKIGHIITRLIIGGAQENTIFTVEGLRKKGYDVTLISGPGLGPEGSLIEETRKKGLRVIIIPELRRTINPFLDTIALVKLYYLIKKEKYALVHTHSSKAGILGRIAAKLARGRAVIIHTIHGLPFHPYQNKILNFVYVNLERFCSLFTKKIICVGAIMKEKALSAHIGNKEKFVVIHSGFEVEKYQDPQIDSEKERRRWGLNQNDIVIGKIGRLFPLKGQRYLLEVLDQIKKAFPQIKLLLVGEGILRKTLEKRAEGLGIEDAVVFTGLLPPEQIPKVISTFDLLVHVSLREGLPKTVAQGLAAGKPVVAFDVDGAKEVVIDGKTGYLVPAKDKDKLANTIIKALRNKEESISMAKEGQKLIKKLFPVEVMVNKIEEVYNDVIGVKH